MSTRGHAPRAQKSAADQIIDLLRNCNAFELALLDKELANRYHDRVISEVLGSIIKLDIEPYENGKTFTKKEIIDLLETRKRFYDATDRTKK